MIRSRICWAADHPTDMTAGSDAIRYRNVACQTHMPRKVFPAGRVLNRVIRCTEHGWEIEPDQRHVDITVRELKLAHIAHMQEKPKVQIY